MTIKKQIKKIIDGNKFLAKKFYRYKMTELQNRINSRDVKPILMGIELTNECPFSCVMCVRTYGMKRSQGHMSESLFKKVIDDYVKFNPEGARTSELTMTHFGESLLNPNFSKLIRYAVDAGCGDTLISINPLMLTPPIQRKLIDSKVHRIHFSLDGHDDQTFKKIRGIDKAFEKSKKNLLEFVKLVKKERVKVYLRLGMVDFDLNAESILEMKSYWSTIGLDEVWVKPATSWSGQVTEVNKVINFSPKSPKSVVPSCMLPFYGLTVTYDGKVAACCSDHDNLLFLGDLNNESITDVFSGPAYRKLREEFISGKVENTLCRSCSQLGISF